MCDRRIKMADGKEVTVRELLDSHVNEKTYIDIAHHDNAKGSAVDEFGRTKANQPAAKGGEFEALFKNTGSVASRRQAK